MTGIVEATPETATKIGTPVLRRHVYFVACGGSLAIMHPAKFLLDQIAPMVTSDVLNAAEFILRAPAALDDSALVVLCSMTGTTRETVAAAEYAETRGAHTIALTMDPGSPLARASAETIAFRSHYTTGIPIDARESNYARIYDLVLRIAKETGGRDLLASLNSSLPALQPAIDSAMQVWVPKLDRYVTTFAAKDTIYTLSSGANYGAAYSFSICVLMEMQWKNSQAIHANEFFHGPFEVVDKDAAFVLLKGLDATRPIEERAEEFLSRFGAEDKVLVLDAADLDLGGLDGAIAPYLVPLIFFDVLWAFAYKIAEVTGHEMLVDRRYMKKIAY